MVMITTLPNGKNIEQHVGNMVIQNKNPASIYADGDELAYILQRFKNIPSTNDRAVIWKGEFARFIVDNLR